MKYIFEDFELRALIVDAMEIAKIGTRIAEDKEHSFISERQAFKLFGSGFVQRWTKEGLITPIKDGNASSKKRYNRMELEVLAKTSNRSTYLPVKERENFTDNNI
jgi:hypothetical protein